MGKQELGDTTTNSYKSEFSFENVLEKNLNYKQCRRSKLTLNKNLNTSKTSIENELIYSKKVTDIPSKYKTEETKFACFKPDIVCYNIETPNDQNTDDAINNKITTRKPKKSSKRVKKNDNKDNNTENLISDPHEHYFLIDNPNHLHKGSVHAVESNISKEPIKWTTSRTRLLHSKLRPDTSKTSNIVLPDVNYTLSTEKLPKPKYPKNVPPPVFKQVGSYKGKIPIMTSKERLRQRTNLRKEQQRLQKLKKKESKEMQQFKFLKKKENTQYDILFGKGNPEEIIEDYDDDSVGSHYNKQSATRKLLQRFAKRPRSESEMDVTMIEAPRPITKSSSVNLFMENYDDEDSEIEEPKEESEDEPEEEIEEPKEESEDEPEEKIEEPKKKSKDEPEEESEDEPEGESKEKPAEESEEELEQKPEQEPKQELELTYTQELENELEEEDEEELEENEYDEKILIEDYFEKQPIEKNLVEIISKKESSIKMIDKQESPITAIEKEEIPIEILQKENTKTLKSKAEKPQCADECTEPCRYKPPYDDTKAAIKPRTKKRLVIFDGCDSQLCTYDEGKQCNKVMINIGTSSREEQRDIVIVHSNRKEFTTESRSSRECPNDYNSTQTKSAAVENSRNSIGKRSETVEQELNTISRNSYRNGPKSSQRNRITRNIKKSTYNSKEVLYEKELQNYDYVTDRVSQNYQNLQATDHNLLLDLNFQNKVTQTYHTRRKEKNIQTTNYFPSNQKQYMSVSRRNEPSSNYNSYSKNALLVSNGKSLKIIHKTPMGAPQLLIINHPTRCQSQMPKPTIDIIYKNSKYSYPKYVKTISPHKSSQKILMNNRKSSYNNNFQYNLPSNENYKMFTYFVNVQQEPIKNLHHSLNLKTIERDLIIKFV